MFYARALDARHRWEVASAGTVTLFVQPGRPCQQRSGLLTLRRSGAAHASRRRPVASVGIHRRLASRASGRARWAADSDVASRPASPHVQGPLLLTSLLMMCSEGGCGTGGWGAAVAAWISIGRCGHPTPQLSASSDSRIDEKERPARRLALVRPAPPVAWSGSLATRVGVNVRSEVPGGSRYRRRRGLGTTRVATTSRRRGDCRPRGRARVAVCPSPGVRCALGALALSRKAGRYVGRHAFTADRQEFRGGLKAILLHSHSGARLIGELGLRSM